MRSAEVDLPTPLEAPEAGLALGLPGQVALTVLARPEEVYDAVTHCHLGQAIRTLSPAIQGRLTAQLEGVELPCKEKHRVRFLRELAGLSARLLEPGRIDTERAVALLGRPGYLEGVAREDLTVLEETFTLIHDIALVCMRSSKPADYVRLLSRPGVDVQRLVTTMPFFAGDRRVRFTSLDMARRRVALEMERLARQGTREAMRGLLSLILSRLPPLQQHVTPRTASDWRVLHACDIAAVMASPRALAQVLRSDHRRLIHDKAFFQLNEMLDRIATAKTTEEITRHTHTFLIDCGIYRTGGGRMLRFGKMFKVGPIEGYVVLRYESLMRYGYAAMTTSDVGDATVLLASEDEGMVQHELQHVFDKITYVESVVDPRRRVQGTRMNLLGMEVRARLAEMAFCSDPARVEDALREARENAGLDLPDRDEMRVRIEADRFVVAKLARCRERVSIQRSAVRLLDQAYRQAYGLTYSQIVEPFTRVSPRSLRPGDRRGRMSSIPPPWLGRCLPPGELLSIILCFWLLCPLRLLWFFSDAIRIALTVSCRIGSEETGNRITLRL